MDAKEKDPVEIALDLADEIRQIQDEMNRLTAPLREKIDQKKSILASMLTARSGGRPLVTATSPTPPIRGAEEKPWLFKSPAGGSAHQQIESIINADRSALWPSWKMCERLPQFKKPTILSAMSDLKRDGKIRYINPEKSYQALPEERSGDPGGRSSMPGSPLQDGTYAEPGAQGNRGDEPEPGLFDSSSHREGQSAGGTP